MATPLYAIRAAKNIAAQVLAVLAAVFGIFWLVWIIWTTLRMGVSSLNLALFTEMTPPPGAEGGGMLNAFFGSALMSMLGILLGAPIGVLAGTYLAEYSSKSWLGETVRFVNDILLSAPSIVLGLFVYTMVVAQMGHFSALAGGIALAFIVLPVVVRTTDEMLRLVPSQMREAALSLGVPQWKVTMQVLYRSALPGIVTGILLALARISGETAPLLFSALNNQYWTTDVLSPMANVPVVIFQYAMSPFENWHSLAWAGAFVLTLFVLLTSLVARAIVSRNKMTHD
ncbi:phosphate ABC transporter permease PstA [Thermomonas sp.]|jgi:phosphate transport system permease protein|uniref:phosphate ABC transporter permease PstA n=1 Tax=Thermomonas sp. TaxID=1971895 RepID=UPI001B634032|nr:phosphate ABC transporter permease PstA [Thermomonas sp.]MBK6332360.1 phosphate ABC transporter permease PstA [Thermomonas sp.]MBK6417017.1 phosphate ABC transporter permease PstA [Thermomonas sp.]MBK6924249.1 phosphate ABC transporter permease PstA [Thermomonas sp.]MBK7204698.1 phosphate ABC transporter permease PstA [Thermomonas sp.]MBK9670238.1 phosphate ABC transporter permease PstA [Thermomonas sp.]